VSIVQFPLHSALHSPDTHVGWNTAREPGFVLCHLFAVVTGMWKRTMLTTVGGCHGYWVVASHAEEATGLW